MADESSPFEMGRIKGALEAVANQLQGHVALTDQRFIRLETKIDKGFEQSQRDREAGNKTIGDMVAKNASDLADIKDTVSRGKGALAVGDWLMNGFLVLTGGVIAAAVSHLLFK